MTAEPTTSSSSRLAGSQPRRGWLALVAVGLALQVAVAAAALTEGRPARYGWQMYSGVPFNPPAWSIHGSDARELDERDSLVHARAEIDRVLLLRERGCELVDADAIRFELSDGTSETVACP